MGRAGVRGVLGIGLGASLACGGLVNDETVSDKAVNEEAAGLSGAAESKASRVRVFEIAQVGEECVWRSHGNGEPVVRLRHPSPCPQLYSVGTTPGGYLRWPWWTGRS